MKQKTKCVKITGVSFDPFIQKYPVEIDTVEIERIKKQEMAKKYVNAYEENVKAAKTLSNMKEIG